MQCMYTNICVRVHIRVYVCAHPCMYACALEDQYSSGTFHLGFLGRGPSLVCSLLTSRGRLSRSPGSACLRFPVMRKLHHIQIFVRQALYQLNVFPSLSLYWLFSGMPQAWIELDLYTLQPFSARLLPTGNMTLYFIYLFILALSNNPIPGQATVFPSPTEDHFDPFRVLAITDEATLTDHI